MPASAGVPGVPAAPVATTVPVPRVHAKKRALIAFSLYLGQAQMWVTLPGLVEPMLDEAGQVLTAR